MNIGQYQGNKHPESRPSWSIPAGVASWKGLILTHCMVEKVLAESSNHIGGDEILASELFFFFFFPTIRRQITDLFIRDVTIELISGKDVEILLKHLGRTCEDDKNPLSALDKQAFPSAAIAPPPRICIPSRIKICTDAATVKKPKIPSSCRTFISLRQNMPLFELAVIDYSYSGRRNCRN